MRLEPTENRENSIAYVARESIAGFVDVLVELQS
jgi:hypothetical protein